VRRAVAPSAEIEEQIEQLLAGGVSMRNRRTARLIGFGTCTAPSLSVLSILDDAPTWAQAAT